MNSSISLKSFAIFGVIFTFVLGCLLHFVYGLSGNNYYVGFFSPVNESVWEHLKLAFYAWLIYGLICYPLLKDTTHNYWLALALGPLLANLFIIIFFYTYSGIMGHSTFILNILSFLIACVIAGYTFYKVLTLPDYGPCYNLLGFLFIISMIFLFAYFTYHPLDIPLFTDWGAKS